MYKLLIIEHIGCFACDLFEMKTEKCNKNYEPNGFGFDSGVPPEKWKVIIMSYCQIETNYHI